jgi:phage terminase small subunit
VNTLSNELNERQLQFVINYVDSGHGTNSAINAGYSEKSAYSTASDLLRNPKIASAIEKEREDRKKAIQHKLSKYAEDAVKILYELAGKSDSDSVRLQAAKDIMDRAGHKPVDKVENKNEHSGKIEFSFTDPNQEE